MQYYLLRSRLSKEDLSVSGTLQANLPSLPNSSIPVLLAGALSGQFSNVAVTIPGHCRASFEQRVAPTSISIDLLSIDKCGSSRRVGLIAGVTVGVVVVVVVAIVILLLVLRKRLVGRTLWRANHKDENDFVI